MLRNAAMRDHPENDLLPRLFTSQRDVRRVRERLIELFSRPVVIVDEGAFSSRELDKLRDIAIVIACKPGHEVTYYSPDLYGLADLLRDAEDSFDD